MALNDIPGGPSGWLTYVQVGDIYGTTQKAKSLGTRGHERGHGSDGHGSSELHSRSDWCDSGALAVRIEVKSRTTGVDTTMCVLPLVGR